VVKKRQFSFVRRGNVEDHDLRVMVTDVARKINAAFLQVREVAAERHWMSDARSMCCTISTVSAFALKNAITCGVWIAFTGP
jgi:hypothetical protein